MNSVEEDAQLGRPTARRPDQCCVGARPSTSDTAAPLSYDPDLERLGDRARCSRGSTATTASIFGRTRTRRFGRRLWRRIGDEGLTTISASAGPAASRAGVDGAGAARPVHQRHGDVPRPDVLSRVPTKGRAAAANVPVHPDLARGVLDRRRGLLNGHTPRGGGTVRARPHLRDGHQRSGRAPGTSRHLPAGADAEYTENYIRAGGTGRSRSTTSPSTMVRSSRPRCSATSCSRSTTSSPTGPSPSSTSSCVVTCSSTST